MDACGRRFSLVEVLVALVVLGVAGSVLMQTMTAGLSLNKNARGMSLATSLASRKIEQICAAKSFADMPRKGKGEGRYEGFRWRRTLLPPPAKGKDLRPVRVEVFWKPQEEDERRISMTTLIRVSSESGDERGAHQKTDDENSEE